MSQSKGWIVAIAVAVLGGLFWSTGRDRDEHELARALAERRQAQDVHTLSKDARAFSDVTRLTDQVSLDANQVQNTSIVQLREFMMPRIKLPAKPDLNGDGLQPEDDSRGKLLPREPNPGFVGAEACAACHRERFEAFSKTAHHQTSKPANLDTVMGPWDPPTNRMETDDPRLSFTMTHAGDQLQQVVQLADWQLTLPVDMIFGSGNLAQTYLYWHGDALYEAHVSYFPNSGRWIASPGFNPLEANYARPIRSFCMECHVTYITEKRRPNSYYPDTVVWGISCERCHGPGKQHIDYHNQNPEQTQANHIVLPSELPRERQLDLCSQCHSGEFKLLDKPFHFRPGDRIEEFHKLAHPDSDQPGVHTSNQSTRLKRSQCFQHSQMTCTTCHNPHQLQRGNTRAFSKACLKCHDVEHCGVQRDPGVHLASDCISCHMPTTQNVDMDEMVDKGMDVKSVDHFIRIPER